MRICPTCGGRFEDRRLVCPTDDLSWLEKGSSKTTVLGASVPIVVDSSKFLDWKTMAFYDGVKKLAEITQGPTRFTATNLTPGYHIFSVLATDDKGNVRTADPKMVVVRPRP